MPDQEWLEIDEIASMWSVPVTRVRANVASLESVGAIKTRQRPGDRRFKQVHTDSLETLKKAVLG